MIVGSKLLKYIIDKWKKDFVGTSALELSSNLNLPHNSVLAFLKILEKGGKVNLRATKLGTMPIIRVNTNTGEVEKQIGNRTDMIDTVIAFPDKEILKEVFNKEGVDYGIFKNRLHKGDSQIKQYYFRQEVLDKYVQYQDRYHVQDSIIAGRISTQDSYVSSLLEGKRDEALIYIRYGKRKLINGSACIAVIVWDLSTLSYQEQQYWASFEITDAVFAEEDTEYMKYIRMTFGAEWVEYQDPIEEILNTIKRINAITKTAFEKSLFRNVNENTTLNYIVVNTIQAYQNAHKELFKLIGTDSLDKDVIIGLLKQLYRVRKEDLLDENGKERKIWGLFKLLVKEHMEIDFKHLQRCFDARVASAHKIQQWVVPNTDLTIEFRKDCEEVSGTLKEIENHL